MAINWLLLRQFLRTDFDRLSFNFFEYLLLPLTAPEIHFAIIRKRDLQRRLLALRQLLLVLLHRRVLRRTIRCLPVLALSLLSLERLLHVTVPRDFQFESLLAILLESLVLIIKAHSHDVFVFWRVLRSLRNDLVILDRRLDFIWIGHGKSFSALIYVVHLVRLEHEVEGWWLLSRAELLRTFKQVQIIIIIFKVSFQQLFDRLIVHPELLFMLITQVIILWIINNLALAAHELASHDFQLLELAFLLATDQVFALLQMNGLVFFGLLVGGSMRSGGVRRSSFYRSAFPLRRLLYLH